ncbi:MAG: hypothetical protein HQK59_06455 [Deltaproteobacteria bacterium]|nr:hypothetical protein [Deltaproteobacteria bacterium]MBF0526912.1 hypothetical protein [Deltaproteobacteria bacterium]
MAVSVGQVDGQQVWQQVGQIDSLMARWLGVQRVGYQVGQVVGQQVGYQDAAWSRQQAKIMGGGGLWENMS